MVADQDGANERELTACETPTAFIGFSLAWAFNAPAWSPERTVDCGAWPVWNGFRERRTRSRVRAGGQRCDAISTDSCFRLRSGSRMA